MNKKPNRQLHYFSPDGQYGGIEGLQIIDTTKFTAQAWDGISSMPDRLRPGTARLVAASRGRWSDDYYELPSKAFETGPGQLEKLQQLIESMESEAARDLETTLHHAAQMIRNTLGWWENKA